MTEEEGDKVVCLKCGNDTFRVYITMIIDDARLYCTKCGTCWGEDGEGEIDAAKVMRKIMMALRKTPVPTIEEETDDGFSMKFNVAEMEK